MRMVSHIIILRDDEFVYIIPMKCSLNFSLFFTSVAQSRKNCVWHRDSCFDRIVIRVYWYISYFSMLVVAACRILGLTIKTHLQCFNL
jgi:hypothetical protein